MILLDDGQGFTTTLTKALDEIDTEWRTYAGLIVPGRHAVSHNDADIKIKALKDARENKLPTLGICFGMQLMAIEYIRHVSGLALANTTELHAGTLTPVIIKMPELRVGIKPIISKDNKPVYETHWHNYRVNNDYIQEFENDWDLLFSEHDSIVEYMHLRGQHYYGVQFHPEYQSSKEHPHNLLKQFIELCKNQTK